MDEMLLPKGFVFNDSGIYDEVASYSVIPPEKITEFWGVYTTTYRRLLDPTASRLEYFWWHVWGSDRKRLYGPVLARIFKDISEGPTFAPLKGPSNRYELDPVVEALEASISRMITQPNAGIKEGTNASSKVRQSPAAEVSSASDLIPVGPALGPLQPSEAKTIRALPEISTETPGRPSLTLSEKQKGKLLASRRRPVHRQRPSLLSGAGPSSGQQLHAGRSHGQVARRKAPETPQGEADTRNSLPSIEEIVSQPQTPQPERGSDLRDLPKPVSEAPGQKKPITTQRIIGFLPQSKRPTPTPAQKPIGEATALEPPTSLLPWGSTTAKPINFIPPDIPASSRHALKPAGPTNRPPLSYKLNTQSIASRSGPKDSEGPHPSTQEESKSRSVARQDSGWLRPQSASTVSSSEATAKGQFGPELVELPPVGGGWLTPTQLKPMPSGPYGRSKSQLKFVLAKEGERGHGVPPTKRADTA